MTTLPLNLLDELYLTLDRENEPWTVQYEVDTGVRLDHSRVASAIVTAARRHPLTRARLMPWRFRDRGYVWAIEDELREVPLTTVECRDARALEETREQLFSTSPSLATAPPFVILLARCADSDSLMLNLHHGAGDGISAERFMLSILRAYAGEDDPVPAVDSLAVHDVRDLAAARSGTEAQARRRALRAGAWRPLVPVARLARDGGDGRPAYGFETFALSDEDSRSLFADHPRCTTVNDALLAGLAVAIGRWNADHGCPDRPVALSMPVNLRPPEWRQEVFGNFASWVTVWVRPEQGEDLSSVVTRVAVRTRMVKRDRLGGMAVDLLRMSERLIIAAKRWLQYMNVFTNNAVVDTASLSNLGTIEPPSNLVDAGRAAVWFSPPCQMPLGLGVGAVTIGDRLHVTMRYRHAQFDRDAARKFAQLFREVLVGSRGAPAPAASQTPSAQLF